MSELVSVTCKQRGASKGNGAGQACGGPGENEEGAVSQKSAKGYISKEGVASGVNFYFKNVQYA